MKETWKWMPMLLCLFTAAPAFAVDTSQTYNSGILVLGFLGFCALILVVQLFPALMMLCGWIKGLFKGAAAAEEKKSAKSH
jgi:hypothetical protein